jgi:regulator of protease activity HflC (stomatin/prohibitin superfamily)
MSIGLIVVLLLGFVFLSVSLKILQEYERGVVFRLGRVLGQAKGPGLIILIPFIDRMVRMSTRTVTMDVEPQDVISRDNVSLKVNAVLYFRVVDPVRAVINVENYLYATSQLAQTHLRSALGSHTLDDMLTEREKINNQLQLILDENTDPWGIKVVSVEIKHIDLPPDMQRAMARQAEAERERRAKVIGAEGELQAAAKLTEAAVLMSTNPMTLQLRYLQTLADMSTEHNSTIIFPLPIDLMSAFMDHGLKKLANLPKE